MQYIIQEFESIDSEAALRAFLQKNGFRMADSRSHADQYVLGAFVAMLDGHHASITHRLFDVDGSTSAGLGRNQLILELDGKPSFEVRFSGHY